MAERPIKQLKKMRAAAMARRRQWEGTWRDAYRYALPQRDVTGSPTPGQPKGDLVFDSTAISGVAHSVNRIQNDLFPPFQNWVKLTSGPSVPPDQRDAIDRQLDDITKQFHAAIQRSNFDTVIGEFLYDLFVGTGLMLVEEGPDWDALNFIAVSVPTVALEEGAWGRIGGYYRDFKAPVSVIEQQWPDATLPAEWAKKKADAPDEEVGACEATYYVPADDTWYYELFRDEEEDKLLTRKYDAMPPWIGARWAKAANEVYGRGPLMYALPDIRTINRVVELILMNASLATAGVYTGVNDGVLNPNTVRLVPGTVIPVQRNEGHPQGPSLVPLPRSGDFDVSQFILGDMRQNIKRLLLDVTLPPETGQPRSATEVIQRIKDLAIETGPTFGRIMNELVVPLVFRCLQILDRKNIIKFPLKIDGSNVAVQIISPLAQSQNLDDVQALVHWLEISSILGPEIVPLSVKVEDVPNWLAKKLGVDLELLRDDTDKKQIMSMVAQFLAQAAAQKNAAPALGGQGQPGPVAGPVAAEGAA